jgi:hypothetical protein
MNDPISHLYTLHTNPFLFASTLHGFYECLGEHERSVLLAYLVLPIVLEQKNRDFLLKARSTSNLRTMLTHRELLTAIPQRLDDYKEATIKTLRYLVSANVLEIKGMSVLIGANSLPDQTAPPGTVSAARKLAEFFKPFDVPAIYRLLGVMQL